MDYQQLTKRLYPEFSDKTMAEHVNVEQMFTLIENVLPVEICLHHQILPLFLEGRHLHLGMVFAGDTAAYEYARRIIAYLNYSLVKQPISSTVLQVALSAYLKHQAADVTSTESRQRSRTHSDHSPPPNPGPNPATSVKAAAPEPAVPEPAVPEPAMALPAETPPALGRQRDRRRKKKKPAPAPKLEQETYIVDSPENLDEAYLPAEIHLSNKASGPAVQPGDAAALDGGSAGGDQPPDDPAQATPPTLALDIRRPELPFERLAELSPRHLLSELLGRVLAGKISRLYFEFQPDRGRILWSDSGVLRSAIDPVDKEQLQGVLNELKQMMQLPLAPLKNTSHAELEYTYGESTVLLRIRTTIGQHGESAMLQVLQGATLKFYQQQQVVRLGQEAIDAAKQVQLKISELNSRMAALPDSSDAQREVLADLAHILRSLGQQVTRLQSPELAAHEAYAVSNLTDPMAQ